MRPVALAAGLLLVCAARHYGWPWAEPEIRGVVSKALGAAAALYLLAVVLCTYRSRLVLLPGLWWAWEEAQTLLCSVAYAADPWPVPVGQGICTARLDFDLGAIGLVVMAVSAYKLSTLTVSETLQGQENDG